MINFLFIYYLYINKYLINNSFSSTIYWFINNLLIVYLSENILFIYKYFIQLLKFYSLIMFRSIIDNVFTKIILLIYWFYFSINILFIYYKYFTHLLIIYLSIFYLFLNKNTKRRVVTITTIAVHTADRRHDKQTVRNRW